MADRKAKNKRSLKESNAVDQKSSPRLPEQLSEIADAEDLQVIDRDSVGDNLVALLLGNSAINAVGELVTFSRVCGSNKMVLYIEENSVLKKINYDHEKDAVGTAVVSIPAQRAFVRGQYYIISLHNIMRL